MINNIKVFIQARMGSTRFPGKSLYPFKGKPSLGHLTDSILQIFNNKDIMVLTSTSILDNEIVEFCIKNEIPFLRGSENNVASRFVDAIDHSKCEYFFRLSGDSPLFDYRILQVMLDHFQNFQFDLLSTVENKNVPSGQNAELVKSRIYKENYSKFSTNDHFEHVTQFFYQNRYNFQIMGLKEFLEDNINCKFSFDTQSDKERINSIFTLMEKNHFEYNLNEKIQFYKLVGK